MKLYIPKIGESIILKKDWIFPLYDEHRNKSLADVLGAKISWPPAPAGTKLCDANIAAGTELIVDRIYVRQDADDFASVTFLVKKHQNNSFVGCRFWAKLEDVNNIEFDPGTSDNICGFGAAAKLKRQVQEAENPELVEKRNKKKQAKEELEFTRQCAINKARKLYRQDYFLGVHCKKTTKNKDGSKTRHIVCEYKDYPEKPANKTWREICEAGEQFDYHSILQEKVFAVTTKGTKEISTVEVKD